MGQWAGLTDVPAWGLHGSNLCPGIGLDVILLSRSEGGSASVATDSIQVDGIEADTRDSVAHVLDGPHSEVHAGREHVGDGDPSGGRGRAEGEREGAEGEGEGERGGEEGRGRGGGRQREGEWEGSP